MGDARYAVGALVRVDRAWVDAKLVEIRAWGEPFGYSVPLRIAVALYGPGRVEARHWFVRGEWRYPLRHGGALLRAPESVLSPAE